MIDVLIFVALCFGVAAVVVWFVSGFGPDDCD